jgi:hypothetical protein
VQFRRHVAGVFATLFVALVLAAAPHSASSRSSSVPGTSAGRGGVAATEAPLAPVVAVSAEHAKRVFSFGAIVGFVAAGLALARTRLVPVGAGAPVGSLRPNALRRSRGRAPPFARA